MGLILCTARQAERPLFIEELNLHVFSLEELCYVISEYPVLMTDGFVQEPLFDFIRNGLEERELADNLTRLKKQGTADTELLCLILRRCALYNDGEINRCHARLQALSRLHRAEFLKRKADFLFDRQRYGRAVTVYEKILAMPDDATVNGAFRGTILNSEGCALANLFLYEKAFLAFERAYGLLKERAVLKRIYFLSLLDPVLKQKERYQAIAGEAADAQWDRAYEKAQNDAKKAPEVQEIEEIFDRDPVIRRNLAAEKIGKWKQSYRNML